MSDKKTAERLEELERLVTTQNEILKDEHAILKHLHERLDVIEALCERPPNTTTH